MWTDSALWERSWGVAFNAQRNVHNSGGVCGGHQPSSIASSRKEGEKKRKEESFNGVAHLFHVGATIKKKHH